MGEHAGVRSTTLTLQEAAPMDISPGRGPASFSGAVAKAPSLGGAGLASSDLPSCQSHGPERRAAPGAELTP